MLLVKSKELKNSNSKSTLSPLVVGFSIIFTSLFPSLSYAKQASTGFSSTSSILSVFLSLLLVIAIIFALAYVMRRFNVAQAGNGQMRVVASMMAGNKEKIMVIEVGDEQHLLGVTAHNINHLATLNEPLVNNRKSASDNENASKLNFQQKLVTAMAQGISGKKNG